MVHSFGQPELGRNRVEESKPAGKPFAISKRAVWEAYERVKANKGAPGVDGCTVEEFEKDLKNNLYKIWNRLSSGTYFPPPVRAVEIPKSGGGVRTLGVPTVADRIAQTVVAMELESVVEPIFHTDSYGYRPGRSALDAVGMCRQRCWKMDWVVDLDISKFFDSVDHDLMVKAVQAHTDTAWVVLYVKRWLIAPLQRPDGTLEARDRGTPQGSSVSPVLANLFLHHAFDKWMARTFPTIPFERYVDDAVVHCKSERQAQMVRAAIAERMGNVGLLLHPDKTKIVYCQDSNRSGSSEHTQFTFLGYTFRPRRALNKNGKRFTSFLPAVSTDAAKRIGQEIRGWRLHARIGRTLGELAEWINPIVRGWLLYYGRFYRTEMYVFLKRINTYLMRWARMKYRRLHGFKKLKAWWGEVGKRAPRLFAHWEWTRGFLPAGW
jgi:RNA-directed DNA polymerase